MILFKVLENIKESAVLIREYNGTYFVIGSKYRLNASLNICQMSCNVLTKCVVGKRSLASAPHCCSLPKRQRMNMDPRRQARRIVNQAPSGTLVSAEDRYAPSRAAIVSHGRSTKYGLMRHTKIATSVTMHVSKNVTNITHTP